MPIPLHPRGEDTPWSTLEITFVSKHFAPNSASTLGDIVFDFSASNQSVVTSNFTHPCVPNDPSEPGSFWTGSMNFADSFTISGISPNTTIFYYSPNDDDCQQGIVGVINPIGSFNLKEYMNRAAAFIGNATAPTGDPYGGTVIRDDQRGWVAQHAGAIIGVMVVLLILIVGGAWFMFRRARKKLQERREQGLGPGGGVLIAPGQPMFGGFPEQNAPGYPAPSAFSDEKGAWNEHEHDHEHDQDHDYDHDHDHDYDHDHDQDHELDSDGEEEEDESEDESEDTYHEEAHAQ